jgi:peptidoglycan hydrolase CwlO-like protein
MAIDLKRSATIIEVIGSVFTCLVVIVTAYVSISVTQARQDERIKTLESNYRDIGLGLKEITASIREINNKQNELMLELKDKQNRADIK